MAEGMEGAPEGKSSFSFLNLFKRRTRESDKKVAAPEDKAVASGELVKADKIKSGVVDIVFENPDRSLETVPIDFGKLPPVESLGFKIVDEEKYPNPVREYIPSSRYRDKIPPEEQVWLTPNAVRDRLKVMIQTNPSFQKKDVPKVVKTSEGISPDKLGADRSSEHGLREGVEPQETVKILKKMGYPFAQSAEGKVGMLVDSSIPADRNSSGRFSKSKGTYVERGDKAVEVSEIVPEGGSQPGIRPPRPGHEAIFIDTSYILKTSQDNQVAVDYVYMDSDKKLRDLYEIHQHPDDGAAATFMEEFFRQTLHNKEKYPQLHKLANLVKIKGGFGKYDRKDLFDALQEAGMDFGVKDRDSFPYEPVAYFSTPPREEHCNELKKNFEPSMLRKIQKRKPDEHDNYHFPGVLSLGDLQTIAIPYKL